MECISELTGADSTCSHKWMLLWVIQYAPLTTQIGQHNDLKLVWYLIGYHNHNW